MSRESNGGMCAHSHSRLYEHFRLCLDCGAREETEEPQDNEKHRFGCICCECAGAELTTDND